MNSTIKTAIERFLLDYNMFQRTFANDVLIYPEEWIEYDTIKDKLLNAECIFREINRKNFNDYSH